MFSFPLYFAILLACAKPGELSKPDSEASPRGLNKTLLLQLVNDARKKGCQCGNTYYPPAAPLSWNNQLEAAALHHSDDMNKNNYFSHTDLKGNSAAVRIREAGYKWAGYAENIAQGYSTEKEVVQGWLSSPGHCTNIMTGIYKEMGVAKSGSYWTQVMATK